MNLDLTQLLRFVPLIAGLILAYHLIFKQQLPNKGLLSIITYFLGIVIVFIGVALIIGRFFAPWATSLLEAGTQSTEWQQFMNASGQVVEDAFDPEGGGAVQVGPTLTPVPVQVQIVVTATPVPGTSLDDSGQAPAGATQYTVESGDTLYSIAQKFNTTVNDIMIANGLTSYTIYENQALTIPASSQ